ncbi:serine--tRNA ligase [archaeon]|jgi:seryl-tRNA synthetase|nr:serine--tRNA ligase [archaeon]MBT6761969.1 serine--tRNA ligase [archaeon]
MLHIKFIRENADIIKASEKRRDHDPKVVDQVLELDQNWREQKGILQNLQQQRNTTSEQINKLMKQKKKDEAQTFIKEMKQLVEDLKAQEEKTNNLKKERDSLQKSIGNVLEDSVPTGKSDADNPTIKEVGNKPKFNFPIKDHQEIMQDLDLVDLDTAAKVSGSRFYYLKNDAVLLDLALQRFAIDLLREKGFDLIYPPFMLNRAALAGGVNLSEFEDTIYKIEDEDLYLIGTSEHPLVALKQNVLIEESEFPIKLCGVSACFRKEAGVHGRDDKGIFRVHQFNKIEEIIYCKPEESKKYFDYAQNLSEEIFTKLRIPFRVVQICTGDIGNKQSLQYDIEGWFPGQNEKNGTYRELTSCSNCTDYQSVTLNTRFQVKGTEEREYAHIINNTAIATARAIAAILENFQQADGTVKVPEVLHPYMSGVTVIGKKK